MTEEMRCAVEHVPESEILEWCRDCDWTYVGPSETPGFCIIRWDHKGPPKRILRQDELAHVRGVG